MTEEIPYSRYKRDHEVISAIASKELPASPKKMNHGQEALWNICSECWIHSPKDRAPIQIINSALMAINSSVLGRAAAEVKSMRRTRPKNNVPPVGNTIEALNPDATPENETFHEKPLWETPAQQLTRQSSVSYDVRTTFI